MAKEDGILSAEAQGLRNLQADLRCRGVIFRVEGESFSLFCQRIAAEYGARLSEVEMELEHLQDS